MKKILPAFAALLALPASTFAAEAEKPAAAPAAPAVLTSEAKAEEFSKEQKEFFLRGIGHQFGKQLGQLEFTAEECAEILSGVKSGMEGKGGQEIEEKMKSEGQNFQKFIRPYVEKAQAKEMKRQMEAAKVEEIAGKAFVEAAAKADKDIVVEPSGLAYKIIEAGSGEKPKPESVVKVTYTGKLIDGTVFDATEKHPDKAPSEFALNRVIPGWTQGLQKIAKGGKIKLWIPAALAYGNEGNPSIKGGSTLVFDVELIEVKAPEKTEAEPAPAPAAEVKPTEPAAAK